MLLESAATLGGGPAAPAPGIAVVSADGPLLDALAHLAGLLEAFHRHFRARLPGSLLVFDVVPAATLRAVRRLPRRVRYALPVFPVLRVRFR